MKFPKFTRRDASHDALFAREEQAGHMVRAAADLLASESWDFRERERYREISRRLGHALRGHLGDARAILAASPRVRDAVGVARPMVSMVLGHEDEPDQGVRTAMAFLRSGDWTPAD